MLSVDSKLAVATIGEYGRRPQFVICFGDPSLELCLRDLSFKALTLEIFPLKFSKFLMKICSLEIFPMKIYSLEIFP